ncbi:adenosylcobinamide kinase [Clostridiales bacterium TF09-2AC]|nr:adenosylcobinamide kinase [Clostridiales bacterium TF09-2AC]
MIYLVTGGSGSGKSEYAENLVMASGCPVRYYVATMTVYGEEGKAKVLRHQELRRGKGFITVECQADVGTALCGIRNSNQEKAILLLECVSNLAANEMFADGGEGQGNVSIDKLADKLVKDILCLASQVKDMVIVTNEVASDGIIYDSGTAGYIRLMGLVNSRLGACSHRVVEVVYGIPVVWKG